MSMTLPTSVAHGNAARAEFHFWPRTRAVPMVLEHLCPVLGLSGGWSWSLLFPPKEPGFEKMADKVADAGAQK